MTRSAGSRTIDGAALLRCMTVALGPEQETAVRGAIMPVEVIVTKDVREACASMSTVLPLIVITDERLSDGDRTLLAEMATACGAEIVTAPRALPAKGFAEKLLAALRVAELRRLGYRA
jgi:hypothetical protein